MKSTRSAWLCIGLIFVLAARAQPEDPSEDQRLILGQWKVSSVRQGGNEVPPEAFERVHFVISEGKISFGPVGQDPMILNYTLDPTKKPKAIDTTHELEAGKPIEQLGIYTLKQDTLVVALAPADTPRPDSFDAKIAIRFVFKRIQATKADDSNRPD